MTYPLTILKNELFQRSGPIARVNRFYVSMDLYSPKAQGYLDGLYGIPAVAVSSPSISMKSALWEFQNVPISIPFKREAKNQVLISFYANEGLDIYSTLLSLIKQYGGEPVREGVGNTPTAFNSQNTYNQAIMRNSARVYIPKSQDTGPVGGDDWINYLQFTDFYPAEILPIDFDSTVSSQPLRFSCLFNYSYSKTFNETGLSEPGIGS